MKLFTMMMIALGLFGPIAVQGADTWEKTLAAKEGSYSVKVEKKKVEVKRVDPGPNSPPFMRLRIHRREDRPLEVRLKAIEPLGQPATYTGHIDQWNQSYVGLELEFSFDKKSWKRIGNAIEKIIP